VGHLRSHPVRGDTRGGVAAPLDTGSLERPICLIGVSVVVPVLPSPPEHKVMWINKIQQWLGLWVYSPFSMDIPTSSISIYILSNIMPYVLINFL
jgi:hypothetical protein